MDNEKDIKKEIKEIAPILSSLKVERKQDVNNAYFKVMQDQILSKIAQQEFDENGKLKSYFEELPNVVQTKVVNTRPTIVKYISAIAAVLLVVFASVFMMNQEISNSELSQENTFVDSLEDDELIYLVEYLDYETEFAMLVIDDAEAEDISDEEAEDMLEYLDESTLLETLEF
jgi:hypothetical protein